ncbi:hypothetical protein DdX_20786 [Ditylenchus destructor]|uniref:Uncharacterized protein n=1 Tax=Ditylenchus destructor TaxID=166010 RepID=A0AAD4MFR6_9BILA|nr:hypothetical protein DdX_20786 [Ditylenchus destructor]
MRWLPSRDAHLEHDGSIYLLQLDFSRHADEWPRAATHRQGRRTGLLVAASLLSLVALLARTAFLVSLLSGENRDPGRPEQGLQTAGALQVLAGAGNL